MKPFSLSLLVLLVLGGFLIAAGCTQNQTGPATGTQVPTTVTTPADNKTLQAGTHISNETLVAFVESAVAYAKTNGKEKALAEFSNPNGSFVKGELYIYAYDFNGTTLAHPVNPEKIGVNRMNETDANVGVFLTAVRNVAQENGKGFVRFSYVNPAHNNTVEEKLGYVEKVDDDWWLGSGIYTGPATGTTVTTPVQTLGSVNETLVAFVDSAVTYAKTNGKDKALAEFSNPNGSFVNGELYIYAYDFNGTTLAHPFNPEKIGVNRLNETDAMGGLFITDLRDMAQQNGNGFVRFYYINPAHNRTVEAKLGYVSSVDENWWLGSGVYFGPVNETATATTPAPASQKP